VQNFSYYKAIYQSCKLQVTDSIAKRIVTLPLYPSVTREQINYVADSITMYFQQR
jgi:dTDP-4-amino-4,6-dideoxygalactose transaminase